MDYSTALVGVVDSSCFQAYFGFGGRAFADAEALSGGGTGARAAFSPELATSPARRTLRTGAAAGKRGAGSGLRAKKVKDKRK